MLVLELKFYLRMQTKPTASPRVIIGIPTYNRYKLLERAIKSAVSQTYSNIEIVVADNASTDKTSQVCEEAARLYQRVSFYRHESVIPACDNFYSLVKRCQGDYIFILGDDDRLAPSAIEKLVGLAIDSPRVVAISSYVQECTLAGDPTIRHTFRGLSSSRKIVQLLHVLNPFYQHLYASACYSLMSISMAKEIYPRRPIISLSGRKLYTGDEISILTKAICSGCFKVYPEPLVYYTGPVGRDSLTVPQTVLVSEGLSAIDLMSYYVIACKRILGYVLQSKRLSAWQGLVLSIYSVSLYAFYVSYRSFLKCSGSLKTNIGSNQ